MPEKCSELCNNDKRASGRNRDEGFALLMFTQKKTQKQKSRRRNVSAKTDQGTERSQLKTVNEAM